MSMYINQCDRFNTACTNDELFVSFLYNIYSETTSTKAAKSFADIYN